MTDRVNRERPSWERGYRTIKIRQLEDSLNGVLNSFVHLLIPEQMSLCGRPFTENRTNCDLNDHMDCIKKKHNFPKYLSEMILYNNHLCTLGNDIIKRHNWSMSNGSHFSPS